MAPLAPIAPSSTGQGGPCHSCTIPVATLTPILQTSAQAEPGLLIRLGDFNTCTLFCTVSSLIPREQAYKVGKRRFIVGSS